MNPTATITRRTFPFGEYGRYQFAPPPFKRTWPDKTMNDTAFAAHPRWCAVDLRDGNQALRVPMTVPEKLTLFALLREMNFKEIETGFPASSDLEFEIHRKMIEKKLIGTEVTPQVLCQARSALITQTFKAMEGCPKWIFHLYNSTSRDQREIVFGQEKPEIIEIALRAITEIKRHAASSGSNVQLQYSPESFTGTEPEFAFEICKRVVETWNPSRGEKIIINLPATVEHTTPNVYADQIEWMLQEFTKCGIRDHIIVSLHTHNDRGSGNAATELGILAGADRVEGTLFGNGERTGNADLLVLALNLCALGIDPKIFIYDVESIAQIYRAVTKMDIHCRHPYAGELAFTAFSGSHQDAIRKGFQAMRKLKEKRGTTLWRVPYLGIDPKHIGRDYREVVRVNSQSGKGGAVEILSRDLGLNFPIKEMQPLIGKLAKTLSIEGRKEITASELLEKVKEVYGNARSPLSIKEFSVIDSDSGTAKHTVAIVNDKTGATTREVIESNQGQVDAVLQAIQKSTGVKFDVVTLKEEALRTEGRGSEAEAAAYIGVKNGDGSVIYGIGISTDSAKAVRKALLAACNQYLSQEGVVAQGATLTASTAGA